MSTNPAYTDEWNFVGKNSWSEESWSIRKGRKSACQKRDSKTTPEKQRSRPENKEEKNCTHGKKWRRATAHRERERERSVSRDVFRSGSDHEMIKRMFEERKHIHALGGIGCKRSTRRDEANREVNGDDDDDDKSSCTSRPNIRRKRARASCADDRLSRFYDREDKGGA